MIHKQASLSAELKRVHAKSERRFKSRTFERTDRRAPPAQQHEHILKLSLETVTRALIPLLQHFEP